ncbi:MAG: hypothetical protein KatS3mg031_2200 [Chitinophagales bacterium]|nr:MAG: hypothetical protein KatS3mg031_2200 [Chitinophagales bacterium]
MKALSLAYSICFLQAWCMAGLAQTADRLELLFHKNHFGFGAELPVVFSKQENAWGSGELRITPVPGTTLEFSFMYNFNRYFGLSTGTDAGIALLRYRVYADAFQFSLPYSQSGQFVHLLPFIRFPFLATPRMLIDHKHLLMMEAGGYLTFFNFGKAIDRIARGNGATSNPIFEMQIQQNKNIRLSFHIAAAYGLLLPNNNTVKISLAYDHGRHTMLTGEYAFMHDDITIGGGRLTSSLNYASIAVMYILTRSGQAHKFSDQ